MFRLPIFVRPDDCDQYGHVNNAVYLAYMESGLAALMTAAGAPVSDWQLGGKARWQLKELQIEYRQALPFGTAAFVEVGLIAAAPRRLQWGFQLKNADGAVILSAEAIWNRVAVADGIVQPLAGSWMEHIPIYTGRQPHSFSQPTPVRPRRRYRWTHEVQRIETNPAGYAHPTALLSWFEDSMYYATTEAGWPPAAMREADFLPLQMRHDLMILEMPVAGATIFVESQLVSVRRRLGTWLHDLYDATTERHLAHDYSTGVFLTWAGRPTSAPAHILNALQFGALEEPPMPRDSS